MPAPTLYYNVDNVTGKNSGSLISSRKRKWSPRSSPAWMVPVPTTSACNTNHQPQHSGTDLISFQPRPQSGLPGFPISSRTPGDYTRAHPTFPNIGVYERIQELT